MYTRRSIKKAIYSITIVVSLVAGTLSGQSAGDIPEEFYKEPYAAHIFEKNVTNTGAEKFSDVLAESWYYDYVDTLVKDGVINGKSETEFDPEGTLTVPECAALIVRCLGLEERAAKEAEALKKSGGQGKDDWYIGYMKVCIDTGIIEPDKYGIGYDKRGVFCVKSYENVQNAVKRYELAAFLSRMTMLDESPIAAENTYSERGGKGHEFIRGGMYDSKALQHYVNEIADFETIPEAFRDSVLRCYYNALFNGDGNGNFNPYDNLTRAQMSKLVAALCDISMRFGNDYRSDAVSLSSVDYRLDAEGKNVLKKQSGFRILETVAERAQLVNAKTLRIPLYSVAPLGYAIEAHVYLNFGDGLYEVGSIGTASAGKYEDGSYIDCDISSSGNNAKVVYILRNIASGGEVEGVLEADVLSGMIVFSDGISYM